MELIRLDVALAIRFNAMVPADAQDLLQAVSKGVTVAPMVWP